MVLDNEGMESGSTSARAYIYIYICVYTICSNFPRTSQWFAEVVILWPAFTSDFQVSFQTLDSLWLCQFILHVCLNFMSDCVSLSHTQVMFSFPYKIMFCFVSCMDTKLHMVSSLSVCLIFECPIGVLFVLVPWHVFHTLNAVVLRVNSVQFQSNSI